MAWKRNGSPYDVHVGRCENVLVVEVGEQCYLNINLSDVDVVFHWSCLPFPVVFCGDVNSFE